MVEGRLPTVPEYYSEHISKNVDLTMFPKQCCPFHKEDTPSFSYNIVTGRWSCFGKCHAHGDVIEMHKRWFHFNSREEAERDLQIKYRIPKQNGMSILMKASQAPLVSEEKIEDEVVYSKLVALATTPDRWIELDYLMSKTPFDRIGAQCLLNKWTGVKSLLED